MRMSSAWGTGWDGMIWCACNALNINSQVGTLNPTRPGEASMQETTSCLDAFDPISCGVFHKGISLSTAKEMRWSMIKQP
jgi:hypothetical protein